LVGGTNTPIEVSRGGKKEEATVLPGHSDDVLTVAFSPDGKFLASGSMDKTVKIWDMATGNLMTTLEGHTSAVRSISVSPDNKTIASAGDDQTVRLWNVESGKVVSTLLHFPRLSVFPPQG
jgi:WD40 repeat protein